MITPKNPTPIPIGPQQYARNFHATYRVANGKIVHGGGADYRKFVANEDGSGVLWLSEVTVIARDQAKAGSLEETMFAKADAALDAIFQEYLDAKAEQAANPQQPAPVTLPVAPAK